MLTELKNLHKPMSTPDKTLKIEINGLTDSQVIAIEDMLAQWRYLGDIGASRWTAFFADGDGNFRPQILVNGEEPKYAKELNTFFAQDKTVWKTIQMPQHPNMGQKELEWRKEYEVYMMDFDRIAWKLKEDQQ